MALCRFGAWRRSGSRHRHPDPCWGPDTETFYCGDSEHKVIWAYGADAGGEVTSNRARRRLVAGCHACLELGPQIARDLNGEVPHAVREGVVEEPRLERSTVAVQATKQWCTSTRICGVLRLPAGRPGRHKAITSRQRRARRAAASRFRLTAAAVRNAWMRMFCNPRRTARASPCQVFASPWKPSERQRWR